MMRLVMLIVLACATVGFADGVVFPDGAVVNLTQPSYNVVPNDEGDDTAAIQRAITDHLHTGRTLYFPDGVYRISKPLVWQDADGLWRPRLVLHGESREGTVLKLIDASSAFTDADTPMAMINTGSVQQEGDSPAGGGNKAFGNYIRNLTIDTGKNNRGAVGIEWANANFGAIENVTIRSGDEHGVAGITMKRIIPGPGLIQHVTIDGFDVGIDTADIQYGLTVEHVAVTNQRTAGVRTSMNLLHVNDLTSINECPAVVVTDRAGVLTIINSKLTGGAADATAIKSVGAVFARDLTIEGYGQRIEARDDSVLTDNPALLPVQPTPNFHEPDLSQWQVVGPRREGEADDTAAIQRAIDSGKRVVWLRNDRVYFISDTIVIRGNVKQLLGFGTEINLGGAKEPFSNRDTPRPLFRIDPTEHEQVFIEDVFVNAQYPGEVIFENNTPADVIIKHAAGWVGADGHRRSYQNTDRATGNVYIEDVFLPGWHFRDQTVWARQFNPENMDHAGDKPQVINDGGKLWILGFKTEGPAPFIVTRNGGVTELLGGYNYISAMHWPKVPADAVPYVVDHAMASLTVTTENFRDNDYNVYLRQIEGGGVTDIKPGDLLPRNGHADRSKVIVMHRTTPPQPRRGDVLWANPLDTAADVKRGTGMGELVTIDGRTALHFDKAEPDGSHLRNFKLPVDKLAGRWINLSADVKAANISEKPLDWNGVKVILKIDVPGDTRWPMIPMEVGSFDWRNASTRILIPEDAQSIEMNVGLEAVSGKAWLDNLRITLVKATRTAPPAPADQPIYKGHDLPVLRGVMVHPRVTQADLKHLAENWGGNVIRYQLLQCPPSEQVGDLEAYDKWLADALAYLDKVIEWSGELGIMVVVDLHSPPGGAKGGNGCVGATGPFWTRPEAQQHFIDVWKQIAKRYKDDDRIWGFDLVNEPDDRGVSDDCDDWQTLAARAGRAVRAIDPDRTLIVTTPMGGDTEPFEGFVPLDLPGVVYTFHMYNPFEYTHQNLHAPGDTITYPGTINGKMWDKAKLEASMQTAIDFAEYLTDATAIFEKHGWNWSYHAYREWHGWNLELSTDRDELTRRDEPGPRLQAILHWMKQNQRAK